MLYAMNFKSWSLRVSVINNKVCARLSSVRCEWGSVSSNVALTHQLSVLFRIATWVWRRQTKRSVMTKSSSLFLLTLYPPTPSPPRCLVPWCECVCVCVRVRACVRARANVRGVCLTISSFINIFCIFFDHVTVMVVEWYVWIARRFKGTLFKDKEAFVFSKSSFSVTNKASPPCHSP